MKPNNIVQELSETLKELEYDSKDINLIRSLIRSLWIEVIKSNSSDIYTCIEDLRVARMFVNKHLPSNPPPLEEISWELLILLRNLTNFCTAYEDRKLCQELKDPKNEKRRILESLSKSDTYLKTQDIIDVPNLTVYLNSMFYDGLIRRIFCKVGEQGVPFYTITEKGMRHLIP